MGTDFACTPLELYRIVQMDIILPMEKKVVAAHTLAFFTMLIWGMSFILSKIALDYLSPLQILFWREIVSILSLFLLFPKLLRWQGWRTELLLFLASVSSMTVYQLLENYAVAFTEASNVSVIVSTAPFFTLLVAHMLDRSERFKRTFFLGFVCAMAGICLFSFNGAELRLGLLGDLLALAAAFSWGFYQSIIKAISDENIPQFAMTRRIFEYAALTLLPIELFQISSQEIHNLFNPHALYCILFLGAICSALCYVTWNYAIKYLGAVKSSVYIYLNPVTTLIGSAIVFSERLGWISLVGVVLTMLGLVISNDDALALLRSFRKGKN